MATLARVPHEEDEVDNLEIEDDGTADEGDDEPEIFSQDEDEDSTEE